jgi:hypothetical protein
MGMNEKLTDNILKDFNILDATDAAACDGFFEKWGAGQTLHIINVPYERLEAYRALLAITQKADSEKYKTMHKGTPFFFIGMLLFDCKNFEAALFYISAALSEDRRRCGSPALTDWITTPAGQVMSLKQSAKWERITSIMLGTVEGFINDFNTVGETTIATDDLINNFVHPMLEQGHYSIITSLYSYMLEYSEKYKNLFLTNGSVDSTEPVLVNLFKGALIFETVLKHYYPTNDRGVRITTLGRFKYSTAFTNTFPTVQLSNSTDTLQEIVDSSTDKSLKTTMENTAKIRNTTGHKLVWDNIFNEPDNYKRLYEQEIFAIFYVISKQWQSSLA